tara:strand:+ start:2609 stop:4423 length:1815 start_codon:yes stop_codon:yes gene_type:complete
MANHRIIKHFNLDLSNLPAAGEVRNFNIIGDNNSEFILEIKDNTTGYYYNFFTNLFQVAQYNLEAAISNSNYKGSITFPAVTGSDDRYDIYLYAKPGTRHTVYNEVRFGDDSIDINSSTGSNSLMLKKVIYQYSTLTLTLQSFSPNSTITGTLGTSTITVDREKKKNKKFFSLKTTANIASAYKIIKQPTKKDLLTYTSLTVGSSPVDLPGEDIYPAVTAAYTVNGAVTSGSNVVVTAPYGIDTDVTVGDKITASLTESTIDGDFDGVNKVVLDDNVADKMAVGDQVTGTGCTLCNTQVILVTHLNPDTDNAKEFQVDTADTFADNGTLQFSSKVNRSLTMVTAVPLDVDNDSFTMSQAIQFRNGTNLSFSKQKNKRWPLNDISKVKVGNTILAGTNVTSKSIVANYQDTVTINPNTASEETIIKNEVPALQTNSQKPTITDGKVTAQPGNIIFDETQVLGFAGSTIKVAGYGEDNILSAYGYDVRFTDLKIKLRPITTTTTSDVTDSTTVPVNSVNGILPSITTVTGVGIDQSTTRTTVESRSVTSGAGNLTLNTAQTLKSGTTLTYHDAGQVAIISGNIEILKAGTANQTIYFDIEKLLSMS